MKSNSLVEKHFDAIAGNYDYYKNRNSFYYDNLKKLLGSLIPQGKIVFEIGCGTGDLLASLSPKVGYGMDISSEMIKNAKMKYVLNKNLHFFTNQQLSINNYQLPDFIFMSDVIEHLENPKGTFRKISKMMSKNTIFINTMANPFWEPVLILAEKLGLKMPEGKHRRISYENIKTDLKSAGLKIVRHDYKLLMPVNIPVVTKCANKYLEKLLKRYAFIEFFTAAKV